MFDKAKIDAAMLAAQNVKQIAFEERSCDGSAISILGVAFQSNRFGSVLGEAERAKLLAELNDAIAPVKTRWITQLLDDIRGELLAVEKAACGEMRQVD